MTRKFLDFLLSLLGIAVIGEIITGICFVLKKISEPTSINISESMKYLLLVIILTYSAGVLLTHIKPKK